MRHRRRLIPLGFALGLSMALSGGAVVLAAPRTAEAQFPPPGPAAGTSTIIHLSKYGNDLHAAFMALEAARALQRAGSDVILWLDIEGVRLADSRVPFGVRWGATDTTMRELYEGFTRAGGRVLVCSHCAAAAGIDTKSLRPGARMATNEDFARAVQSSVQIMDY